MKIQVVIHRYTPIVGGAEKLSAQVIHHLQENGHEVRVLTYRVHPTLAHEEWIDGVYVRRLSPSGVSRWVNIIMVFRVIVYLWFHRRDFDLIQSYVIGPVGLAAIVGGTLARKPVVVRVATYGELQRLNMRGSETNLYKVILRRFLLPPVLWKAIIRRAAAIIALSQQIVEESRSVGLGDKAVYIPNGIDPTQYYPVSAEQRSNLRRDLNIASDDFIIFCTSRLVARKRLDVLIDALPSIQQHVPQARLLIAGSAKFHDSALEALQAQAQRLGVQDTVLFLGEVANVADYLRVSDVFGFPSEREGMPNAVLEAMASRLPIVAAAIGGVIDLLDVQSGWVLPVGDSEAFADAIVSVATNPQLAETKAENAYQRALQQFSIAQTADKYLTLYNRVLNRAFDSAK